MNLSQQIKVISSNGQVYIGKEFAGKTVLVDQVDKGIWVIKIEAFIPESEKWLYRDENLAKLDKALKWAEENTPSDNFEQFIQGIKE